MDLKNLDIEILLDKSGSMGTNSDTPSGKSRWESAQETIEALAGHVEKFDPDGLNIVPFANSHKVYQGVKAATVRNIFTEQQTGGGTDTAAVLKARLDDYFAQPAATRKSRCLLVLTDGEPNNRQAVSDVIIDATKKMTDDGQLAISFIQVGRDATATSFLKELDDGLQAKGAKYDIVDTLPIDEVENLTAAELIEKAFAD